MDSHPRRVKILKVTADSLIYASIFLGAATYPIVRNHSCLAILLRFGRLDRVSDRCIGRCKGLENGIPFKPRTCDSDASCLTAKAGALFASASWTQSCLPNFHRRISAPSCSNPGSL